MIRGENRSIVFLSRLVYVEEASILAERVASVR